MARYQVLWLDETRKGILRDGVVSISTKTDGSLGRHAQVLLSCAPQESTRLSNHAD
jgi:hypothetical protein